jgi:hypothetical protein
VKYSNVEDLHTGKGVHRRALPTRLVINASNIEALIAIEEGYEKLAKYNINVLEDAIPFPFMVIGGVLPLPEDTTSP